MTDSFDSGWDDFDLPVNEIPISPIDKLNDAIHTFLGEAEMSGSLVGWVLSTQTSTIDSQDTEYGPLKFNSYHFAGPATSVELGLGLTRACQITLESHIRNTSND